MERAVKSLIADMEDEVAVPRKNGELVFEAPWEARAFGLAVALNERNVYEWESFRRRLIEEIGKADRERVNREGSGEDTPYYEKWLGALRRLLLEEGLLAETELEDRVSQVIAENDHGHSH